MRNAQVRASHSLYTFRFVGSATSRQHWKRFPTSMDLCIIDTPRSGIDMPFLWRISPIPCYRHVVQLVSRAHPCSPKFVNCFACKMNSVVVHCRIVPCFSCCTVPTYSECLWLRWLHRTLEQTCIPHSNSMICIVVSIWFWLAIKMM